MISLLAATFRDTWNMQYAKTWLMPASKHELMFITELMTRHITSSRASGFFRQVAGSDGYEQRFGCLWSVEGILSKMKIFHPNAIPVL